ncbi:MAG: nucleoside-diphosphate sugar epimerase/dehydratase [Eubacteriales bacterium]|nr:nucleoside-diphosphate sugar epimerase/dehydratase [Eubacteriales bacterium]
MKKKEFNYQLLIRRFFLVLLDILCIIFASFFALATRFEFIIYQIPEEHLTELMKYEPIFVISTLIIFVLFRIYNSLWEYAGPQEIFSIIWACVVSGVLELGIVIVSGGFLPRSYYLLRTIYIVIFVIGTRFSYRMIRLKRQNRHLPWKSQRRVMVIGAGEAGRALIVEIQNSKYLNQRVCCAIDDDPNKVGKYIHGVKVVGDRNAIKKNVYKYNIQQIIITIPSASAVQLRPILDICKETTCELKILPGVYQLVNGEVNVSRLRPVSIDDLLGRDEIQVNLDEIMGYVSNKVIMVTGGGGSIGSELCRQIAAHNPKQLIIFDIYENNAYNIQQELKKDYPELKQIVLIGSIRDEGRLDTILERYRPQIIYHAAAHKHVPLMEDSPNESIKNNVMGTFKLAKSADKWKVERFIQISTDKAVNPTNIMGASKRICEMIIQMFSRHSKTEFVAVRFGNVLGSNGSVIPLFKKQIADGGPVTVTHPDIIRYFMTIPEAVSLVLQAGAYAKGGEIFVLDMGEPVKILDLAKNLIRLSGLTLGKDIEIIYTGLRPGEKLYEELLMDEEGMKETQNKLIHIGKPIEFDEELLNNTLLEMKEETDEDEMRKLVKKIVPTYVLPEEWKEDLKTLA